MFALLLNTNTSKSLVYQVIPVITKKSILVILPIIILMEDQITTVL